MRKFLYVCDNFSWSYCFYSSFLIDKINSLFLNKSYQNNCYLFHSSSWPIAFLLYFLHCNCNLQILKWKKASHQKSFDERQTSQEAIMNRKRQFIIILGSLLNWYFFSYNNFSRKSLSLNIFWSLGLRKFFVRPLMNNNYKISDKRLIISGSAMKTKSRRARQRSVIKWHMSLIGIQG